jgi:hypothetical protein
MITVPTERGYLNPSETPSRGDNRIPEAYLIKQLRGLGTSAPPTLLRTLYRLFYRLFYLSLLSCFLTLSLGFLYCLSYAFLFLISGDFDIAAAISYRVA